MKERWQSVEYRAKLSQILKERWRSDEFRQNQVQKHKGSANPQWKGGRQRNSQGYIKIWDPTHPRAGKQGFVPEHILVWEQAHSRPLPPDWVIHHVNGIKDDNRSVNLLAVPKGNHHYALLMQGLQARIRAVEAELRKIKAQGKFWE